MICLLGHLGCGVVCFFPLNVEEGSVVRISTSAALPVLGAGTSMVGNTYRLLSRSSQEYPYDGKMIPIFGVQIQEDVED